jgi:putative transposase
MLLHGGRLLLILWRIVISPNPLGFPGLLRFFDAQSCRSFHPFHRRPGSVARSGRGPFSGCGVLLHKHQILILNRSRKRSPHLHASDRIRAALLALLVRPTRLLRSAIVLKSSTLLALHKAMSKGKYRMLFSPDRRRQPGPRGPSAGLIHVVIEMKQRNSNWGCPRIAQQMASAFHIQIDKDVVRRILARHYGKGGPRWSYLADFPGPHERQPLEYGSVPVRVGHVADPLGLVVMDQYTRRIIGFGVHARTVDGVALRRMFNCAIRGQLWMPKYVSSDNDPLYRFHQQQANLRILELPQIKSIPYVPCPSVRGKAKRHDSTRVFGSPVVLGDCRS